MYQAAPHLHIDNRAANEIGLTALALVMKLLAVEVKGAMV